MRRRSIKSLQHIDWGYTLHQRTVTVALMATAIVAVIALITAVVFSRSSSGLVLNSDVETEAYVTTGEGYSFLLPVTWQELTQGTDGDSTVHTYSNNGHRIRFRTVSAISTDTLIPAPATPVVLQHEVVGSRYRDYDPATGQALDRVVIPQADGNYVEVSGYGPIFERVIQSFIFVS